MGSFILMAYSCTLIFEIEFNFQKVDFTPLYVKSDIFSVFLHFFHEISFTITSLCETVFVFKTINIDS